MDRKNLSIEKKEVYLKQNGNHRVVETLLCRQRISHFKMCNAIEKMLWELTIHFEYHNKIQLLTSKSTKLRTLLIMCNLMSRLSDVKSRWAQNVRTHSYTYDSTYVVSWETSFVLMDKTLMWNSVFIILPFELHLFPWFEISTALSFPKMLYFTQYKDTCVP